MSEQWTDDEIIGAILAGGSIRPLRAHLGSFGEPGNVRWRFGESTPESALPCCAIGAGILFRGLNIIDNRATKAFAVKYAVSEVVAIGVSDGFEDCRYTTSVATTERQTRSADYARGWAIGAAVRAAIETDPTTERLIAERSGK